MTRDHGTTRRRLIGLTGGAVAGAVFAPAIVSAEEREVQLKISLWVPPAHPLVPATKEWAASLEKASNGTIKSVVFPSEQLGKAFDHYDMARDGIADVTYVNPGYQPGRFALVSVGQIPFTFTDGRNGTKAFDSWYRKYAAAEMKDVHFCFGFIHDPGSIHSRQKIASPADMKGVKARPAQSTIGQLVTMLGGTNVQASAPESRDMLERGVADAIFFPWGSVFLFGIDKVVKYHMDVPLYSTVFVYAMNKTKYESLSPAQKAAVDAHCTTEWAEKVAGPWADFEAAGRERMRSAPGHEVFKLTDAQLAEWKKTVEPLQQVWADSVKKAGLDPETAMSELKASLAKFGAGF